MIAKQHIMPTDKYKGSESWIFPSHRTSPGQWIRLLETKPRSQLLWEAARWPYHQSSLQPLLHLRPAAPRLTGSLLHRRRMVRLRWSPWGTGQATLRRLRAVTVEPLPETRRTPQVLHRTWKVREIYVKSYFRKKGKYFICITTL